LEEAVGHELMEIPEFLVGFEYGVGIGGGDARAIAEGG
jgi:hypothetical protein